MSRKKQGEEHIRRLFKSGSSYAITLPVNIVRSLKLREGELVSIEKKGKTIIIKDAR